MANYYEQIYKLIVKSIHKVLIQDRKGLKIGTKGEAISLLDIHILEKIGEAGHKKIYQLVEDISMDRRFIASCVKKLLLNGYIEKERSEKDKRVHILKLTEYGKMHYKKYEQEQKKWLNFVLSEVTLNEEKAIVKFLSRINRATFYETSVRDEKE